jgi:hypothetical protein
MKGDLQRGVPGLYYLGAREIFHLLEQVLFHPFSRNSATCM